MAKVEQFPVISITGQTGSGKSHIAQTIARKLNPAVAPFVCNIGPQTQLTDLFGHYRLVDEGNEQKTVLEPAP